MASYLYNGLCYAAPSSVYQAMAADCPPVTSSGASLSCSPVSNGITITVGGGGGGGGGGGTTTLIPTLENCLPEYADAAELGGLVVIALVAAFALKMLWRAI